ncbi:hypothetical protein V5799_030640 [Amblyomma americanum]|uniref:Uncharacterized protein n=1 Tax=Amblyomma americanum TaxID=6943 RepID=A0AAQ4EMR3_AMBAM
MLAVEYAGYLPMDTRHDETEHRWYQRSRAKSSKVCGEVGSSRASMEENQAEVDEVFRFFADLEATTGTRFIDSGVSLKTVDSSSSVSGSQKHEAATFDALAVRTARTQATTTACQAATGAVTDPLATLTSASIVRCSHLAPMENGEKVRLRKTETAFRRLGGEHNVFDYVDEMNASHNRAKSARRTYLNMWLLTPWLPGLKHEGVVPRWLLQLQAVGVMRLHRGRADSSSSQKNAGAPRSGTTVGSCVAPGFKNDSTAVARAGVVSERCRWPQ